MRSKKSIFLGLVGAVAACGGDDGIMNPIDATPTIDASQIDAPPAGCGFNAAYPDPLSLGSMDTPFAFNRPKFDHDGMPGTEPVWGVIVSGILNEADPPQGTKLVLMLLIDTVGSFATPNDFTAPPTAMSYPLEMFPTCGACIEGHTGYQLMGGNPDLATSTGIYLITGGNLVLDSFTPAAAEGVASDVFGYYDNVQFQGYEPDPADPNNLIMTSCTTSFTRLNFFFRPTWMPAAVAPAKRDGHRFGLSPSSIPQVPMVPGTGR